jgi:hypothetical protein
MASDDVNRKTLLRLGSRQHGDVTLDAREAV